jgi:hypothetical protein
MAGGRKTRGGPDERVAVAPFNPMGSHTQRADLTVVRTLTPPIVNLPISKIIIQAFDQNIRYTLDGSDPTAGFGFRLTATGDPETLTIGPNTILKFLEEAATATLSFVWGN